MKYAVEPPSGPLFPVPGAHGNTYRRRSPVSTQGECTRLPIGESEGRGHTGAPMGEQTRKSLFPNSHLLNA